MLSLQGNLYTERVSTHNVQYMRSHENRNRIGCVETREISNQGDFHRAREANRERIHLWPIVRARIMLLD